MPIRRKLTFLVLAVVMTALSLSAVALLVKHWQFEQAAMIRQLDALCSLIGENTTASIDFDDNEAAAQVLHSLYLQPSIEVAYIYQTDGSVFAEYHQSDNTGMAPPMPQTPGYEFLDNGKLGVSRLIRSGDETLGTIYFIANMHNLRQQQYSYSTIVLMVILTCALLTYLASAPLQRSISAPILKLADTAERISAEENYSLRVTKETDDEIGMLYDQFNRMLDQVETSKTDLQEAHDQLELRVEQRTRELSDANFELSNEIIERRRAERELEQVHREFVEAARHAGMAEIASGVLHNVGNVLNSVNVSANTILDKLKKSKRSQLTRLSDLLDENSDNLATFLTEDSRGQQVPTFLRKLSESLKAEDDTLLIEAASLTSNIEHIKAIIATQQSYAGTSGLIEPMNVNEILEDVIKLNTSSFDRHEIRIARQFADLSDILVDKQRLLQIVINLVKNAKEALLEQNLHERVLRLSTFAKDDQVVIQVSDTGVGIEPHNLSKIFTHGFSTKSSGHGFGLHSCANAAATMDGELTVTSGGSMQGATFTLTLPYKQVAVEALERNAGNQTTSKIAETIDDQ